MTGLREYFFEAVVGLAQIQRLMGGCGMKEGGIVRTLWSMWLGGVGFE